MEKFIVGFNLPGYKTVNITDEALLAGANELIVVLSEEDETHLKDYYNTMASNLRLNSVVVLISTDENNTKFKPLARLMTTYRNYNIYCVASKDLITASYIKKILGRKPSFNEIQTYIGGDVAAYAELSTIMYGIESIIKEGRSSGLETFLEQHVATLENLMSSIDYMKSICEINNTNEIVDKMNDLQEEIIKNKTEAERCANKLQEVSEDKAKIEGEMIKLKNEVVNLKNSNSRLKEEAETNSGGILSSFSECNTAAIKCKTKSIIYFKEISYVPYVNTLVMNLYGILKEVFKIKAKLVIYDNKTELYQVYKPLSVIDGKTYMNSKQSCLSVDTKPFVVAEPVPMIIEDLLTSDNAYDVLIIYDRMKCAKDIVIGNNVTKFFVVNSNSEYTHLLSVLNIVDESRIITRPDANFAPRAISIPYIDRYDALSDSKKMLSYRRLDSPNNQNIFNTICGKARLEIKQS